jgi:hypothetical protein
MVFDSASADVIIDGTGLAVHFAFFTQRELEATDLLDRYKAYAEENICIRASSSMERNGTVTSSHIGGDEAAKGTKHPYLTSKVHRNS